MNNDEKDGYLWEDDVVVMRNEENHWDSKNITEKLKRNVEKMSTKEENKK